MNITHFRPPDARSLTLPNKLRSRLPSHPGGTWRIPQFSTAAPIETRSGYREMHRVSFGISTPRVSRQRLCSTFKPRPPRLYLCPSPLVSSWCRRGTRGGPDSSTTGPCNLQRPHASAHAASRAREGIFAQTCSRKVGSDLNQRTPALSPPANHNHAHGNCVAIRPMATVWHHRRQATLSP